MSASVILEVPEGTVAVVLLNHADGEMLLARYAEASESVPAPKRQVALALRMLADEIELTIPSKDGE